MGLFENPVRGHYRDPYANRNPAPREEPVLILGTTSDDKWWIVEGDGRLKVVEHSDLIFDWRLVDGAWLDLEPPGEGDEGG